MPPLPRTLAVAACTLLVACTEVSAPSALRPTPAPSRSVADRSAAADACWLEVFDLSIAATGTHGYARPTDQRAVFRAAGAAHSALEAGRTQEAMRTLAGLQTTVRGLAAADRLEEASVAPLTAAAQRVMACVGPAGS